MMPSPPSFAPVLGREALAEFVRAQWPDLGEKLGDRVGAFVDTACNSATRHVRDPGAVARFVNLCCVFGPGFEQKPENEWARAILANDRLAESVKLHQLVVRGPRELQRRQADGGEASSRLLRADAVLLDRLQGEAHAAGGREAAVVGRKACDLEAVQIAVVDAGWRREYRRVDGAWRWHAAPALPQPLRLGRGAEAPRIVSMLAWAPGEPHAAALRVRVASHAVCDAARHPQVDFAGPGGLSVARGTAAATTDWTVHAIERQPAGNGLGCVLLEETPPRPARLRIETCGLRDDGVPTGPVELFVCAYRADRWLLSLEREAGPRRQWPAEAGSRSTPAAARCRLECNGDELPSTSWRDAWGERLDAALAQGLDRLFDAWCQATGDAAMSATPRLLAGKAAWTWGWHEGPSGLAGPAQLHAAGELELVNALELVLTGEVAVGAARARIRLRLQGEEPMRHSLRREGEAPALAEMLAAATCRWRFPCQVDVEPLAGELGALCSEAGPCTGALVGEAGLRPRAGGGGGWQWYARMSLEPVALPMRTRDPVLGQSCETLALLPALPLLDWSAG